MPKRASIVLVLILLVTPGFAKDKNKKTLPDDVLRARTVAVLIDPDAGVSLDNPRANQNAQKDVETALLNWGRLEPILATQTADLIIVIRKGNGRLVNDTINDPRQNNRAGAIDPSDNGLSVGGQHGPSSPSDPSNAGPQNPRPQTEIGETNDSFAVYRGEGQNPLSAPPVWRYVAPDGLTPGLVPAVQAFRKAVADAEKAAKTAGKTP
jgi:hypothetical protein